MTRATLATIAGLLLIEAVAAQAPLDLTRPTDRLCAAARFDQIYINANECRTSAAPGCAEHQASLEKLLAEVVSRQSDDDPAAVRAQCSGAPEYNKPPPPPPPLTAEALRTSDTAWLCRTWNFRGRETAIRAEIERRGQITAEEWRLIDRKQINLGMSENAMLCAWGTARDVNSSVGSWGVHRQYVYSSGTYVYIENGKITSWQE